MEVRWLRPVPTVQKPMNQKLLNEAYEKLVNIDTEEINRRFLASRFAIAGTLLVYIIMWNFGKQLSPLIQTLVLLPFVAACVFGQASARCGI
jgi:hypothetical protein